MGRSRGAWRFLIRWARGLSGTGWYPGLIVMTPSQCGLIDCASCGADCVSPIDWETADKTHWWIRLRCGACETRREVVVSDEVAQSYDRALKRHCAVIARAVERLDHERMAAELDAFIGALDRDLIDASWFTR